MASAKRYLLIAICFALALTVFAAFAPRTVHAVTATLVQIVNTAANPVMTRSVDEPARVPYFATGQATCPFTNKCLFDGTTVPAGKRLRVTRIEGALVSQYQAASGFVALQPQGSPFEKYVMFPFTPFNGAFFGTSIGFSYEVDVYIEAGNTPQLEIGVPAGNTLTGGVGTRMSIVGYLVDVAP